MFFSVHFETLGCRLNQIESESAAHFFSSAGFSVDMTPITAKSSVLATTMICVVNTCTVTGKAEQKARRMIRLLLRKYPAAVIIVTGCYAQMDGATLSSISNHVIVLPGQRKDILADIPEMLCSESAAGSCDTELLLQKIRAFIADKISIQVRPDSAFRLCTDTFLAHSRSSLKIQDGCNNSCTYCRIHLARGRSVSLDVETVLNRVLELENSGQNEVVITSVNIAQYRGTYKNTFFDFPTLLEFLLEHTNKIRIRLSSLYPEIVNDRLCILLKNERVCPSFHLSVQSGSDSILTAMKRPYSSQTVRDAVVRLRKAKNHPFIACDIIAGFPGETDDDFSQTLDLCHFCDFSWIHAFPFSPRPGTPAYTMKPCVPQSVAGMRVAALTKLACNNKIEYINSYCGSVLDAIAESMHNPRVISYTSGTVLLHAVTINFIHAELRLPLGVQVPRPGQMIKIRILEALETSIRSGAEVEAIAALV